MRGLFATATAVFQVALYKRVHCKEQVDPWDDDKTTVRRSACIFSTQSSDSTIVSTNFYKDCVTEVKAYVVFNDPIHGHIELPRICVMIINTPEFRRLRHIKQLGATYEVFPGAAHNRFEHCLGVCHLAGTFGKHLKQQIEEALKIQKKQQENGKFKKAASDVTEEMKITRDDILCLQIAGLCHDIGHGPMSHAFESHFIRKLDPFSKWKHEKGSVTMFDHLVKKNKIPINDQNKAFIELLIYRDKEDALQKTKNDTGRPKEKDFLYEIISNEENGIDVDKWDYFARDSYYLGFRNNFDHNRLIKFSRVIKAEGEWHICYRDKQVEDIYHMYMTRVILHRRACQHKTVQILERMYMEALEKANEHYRIKTGNWPKKKEWKISECINDQEAFSKLTDHVFHDIRNSSDCKLKDARKILEKIETRNHYKLVSEALSVRDEETGLKEEAFNEIVKRFKINLKPAQKEVMNTVNESSHLREVESQILKEVVEFSNGSLKKENLVVDVDGETDRLVAESPQLKVAGAGQIAMFNYGRGERNPVDKVYFYNKTGQGQKYRAFRMPREDISQLLPHVYSEHHIRLYIKKHDDKLMEEARKCFRDWCREHKMNGKWKFQEPSTDE